MYKLYIKIDENLKENDKDMLYNYYNNYICDDENSGIDLLIPENISGNKIDHKISCKITKDNKNVSYLLIPRSSISKTNFRMSNSIGLIDNGYRGNIIAKIDRIPIYNNQLDKFQANTEIISRGTRMFQLVVGDLTPISEIIIVDDLGETNRGTGGFGSTGL